jgi:GNAT superfamily N-acetyltransferase
LQIRRANDKDEEAVFKLFGKLSSRQRTDEYKVDQDTGIEVFRNIIRAPSQGVIILAIEEGEILGAITLSFPIAIRCSGPYARIEEFIVDEEQRGKGVGTKLLDEAIEAAVSIGCFDLQVNNPSDLGLPLYNERGFKDSGNYMRLKL